jgi:hypothetical protein
MAPPGRKGDKIHNSTQHTGTGCNIFKTPTRRYGHDMSKRIYPILLEGECPSVSLPTINIQLECHSNRLPEGILGDLEVCSAIKPFLLLVLLVKLQSYDVWIAGKIIAQT